jgi:hypothetical protein
LGSCGRLLLLTDLPSCTPSPSCTVGSAKKGQCSRHLPLRTCRSVGRPVCAATQIAFDDPIRRPPKPQRQAQWRTRCNAWTAVAAPTVSKRFAAPPDVSSSMPSANCMVFGRRQRIKTKRASRATGQQRGWPRRRASMLDARVMGAHRNRRMPFVNAHINA